MEKAGGGRREEGEWVVGDMGGMGYRAEEKVGGGRGALDPHVTGPPCVSPLRCGSGCTTQRHRTRALFGCKAHASPRENHNVKLVVEARLQRCLRVNIAWFRLWRTAAGPHGAAARSRANNATLNTSARSTTARSTIKQTCTWATTGIGKLATQLRYALNQEAKGMARWGRMGARIRAPHGADACSVTLYFSAGAKPRSTRNQTCTWATTDTGKVAAQLKSHVKPHQKRKGLRGGGMGERRGACGGRVHGRAGRQRRICCPLR